MPAKWECDLFQYRRKSISIKLIIDYLFISVLANSRQFHSMNEFRYQIYGIQTLEQNRFRICYWIPAHRVLKKVIKRTQDQRPFKMFIDWLFCQMNSSECIEYAVDLLGNVIRIIFSHYINSADKLIELTAMIDIAIDGRNKAMIL